MLRSEKRILTTHAGSLPRPPELLAAYEAWEQGSAGDAKATAAKVTAAVADIVRKQIALGIDIVDDGEMGKPSFVSYVNDRFGGCETDPVPRGNPWAQSREARAFPEFYAQSQAPGRRNRRVCTAPITYRGRAALEADLANLKSALVGAGAAEAFVPAISPSSAADWLRNGYYKTEDDYLLAVADALREEYEAIVGAGFLLQIDDPQLVTQWVKHPELDLGQYCKWAERQVEALNHALRNIPSEKVRHHTCYGINMGPRIHDLELVHVVDIILRIRADAYSFEASNPRHEHEWQVWEKTRLPAGKCVIPGVISHSTVLVEHPELVAQRIERFARVVGRENVIAGTDCGFATFAGSKEVHPSIVWAKFEALAQGARIASKRLWS